MKAFGYIRVSTEEQAKKGLSLDNQRQRIKAYCKSQDWDLLDILYDENGSSGKNMDRPAIKELIEKTKLKGMDIVIVYKVDRLSRRQRDLIELLAIFEDNKVGFRSVTESFDTTTPGGKAFLGMLGVFAQLERDVIIERITDALHNKKQKGEPLGPAPLGYKYEDKRLVPVSGEQEIINYIKKLRHQRIPFYKIAKRLNEEGIVTKRGGKWASSLVYNIVKNGRYKHMAGAEIVAIKGK